ncbi:MAG: aminotransferase class V-fold PLP-dependent enzyme [Halieaceae bacterium]|jgi:cysteine desulfurase|nr:aminotransferase class V-fold PLP-dependent enzyme [Halieaceae bacterium]
MQKPVYLDYSSTTPVAPRVAAAMAACLTADGVFANPASRSHRLGWQAEQLVEEGRNQLADLINADPREIIFTSGATESDNLAIKGAAQSLAECGRHVITSRIEHKAVLDCCQWLEGQGFDVSYLAPAADGSIAPGAVADALRPDTVLVTLMHANNETGVLNDIAAIGALCRDRGVAFHSDAAQSVGKIPVDVATLPVDMLSISAHKFYGPKGVGALYLRRGYSPAPLAQIHGGGHERGMRSGTLATHQIVGMGEAAALAAETLSKDAERISTLRERLWTHLQAQGGVHLNGDAPARLPGTLNVAFEGVEGETLLSALPDLALSTGSACTSAAIEPSHVLRGMGLPDALAHSSLRITVGRYTTAEEIDFAAQRFTEVLARLRPGSLRNTQGA